MLFSRKIKPLAIACALSVILTGCGESTSSTSGPDFGSNQPDPGQGGTTFDEQALLTNLVDNVITPTFIAFQTQSEQNIAAVSAYCGLEQQVLAGEAVEAQRDEAYTEATQSWHQLAQIWQHAELMQVGPLVENDKQLRNVIYSWPAKSLCGIDQDVAYFEDGLINLDPNKPFDIKDRTANRRGLISLEHLLFNQNLAHNCSVANDALADWDMRPEQSRKVARCQFAVEVAKDLHENATVLVDTWQADNGYANALKSAGQPGSQFDSAHQAVNVISDALFYLTEEVKDNKLAVPLGLGQFTNSCGKVACPQDVESGIANSSLTYISANIAAFEQLFLGQGANTDNTTGFDDFLDQENGKQVKDAMILGIANAKAAVNDINGDLQQALIDENDKVVHTHDQVKAITDQLKNDFINKLALELPKTSAGDND